MECILLLRANYLRLFIPITLLLLLSFPVLASRQEQKITLNVSNKTLKNVFHAIEEQADVLIMYDLAVIDDNEKVSINVKEMVLEEVLNKLFYNKPVKWSKKGNVVRVFIEAPVKEPGSLGDLVGPLVTVTGKVTDEDGAPLPYTNIFVKSVKLGTSTDDKGIFVLTRVPENSSIIISYTGYETKEISIKGLKKIEITLKKAISNLDETVIQGYGTTTRRTTTSNIGRVTAEEIEKQPVINPLLALQGKVAGLDITQTSGYASAPIKVELRGRSAINSQFTSDPLYVIDGVPLTVLELNGRSSYDNGSTGFVQTGIYGPANGQSPLFSINPADIASIEVLKDADATSIYGSRGANGVILITTKKGKAGKTKFDIHIQQGVTKATRFYKLLNTPQYIQMRREAFKNDGRTPDAGNAYDLLSWDTTRYTDWQRALYGNTGKVLDAEVSLSGGDANTTFRIGAGYNHTTNILTARGADQRGSVSFNLTHNSKDQRFNISLTNGYGVTQSDMVSLPGNITLAPDAPAIYDSLGNLNYDGWGKQNASGRRAYPFSALKQSYISKTNFLNSNLSLNYKLLKGVTVSTSLGYNTAQANQQYYVPISSQDPLRNPTGSAQFGYSTNKNLIIEPQLTYDVVLGKGKFNILFGASYQQSNTEGVSIYGSGYTSDDLLRSISNAPSQATTTNFGEYKYAAVFGRINYNWQNKYILNLSARRDGSSRFGIDRQYGNFGALGAAWIFTEENFFKESLKFLSFGKLRGSYGTTGSDAVGDYQYLTQWSSSSVKPYNGISPLIPLLHANPNFRWQVNRKLEGAIDIGIFKGHINLSIAYYRNRVGNQLVAFPTPAFSGFTSVTANSPALVQNSGWEFTVGSKIIHTRNFDWSANLNVAINRNKLVAYPNFSLSPYASTLVIGQPLNITRKLHYTGVDPKTGQYTFEDKDRDGQISVDPSAANDLYVINLSPDFFGGLGTNFNFKGLQLSLFFNIKKQIGVNAINQGSSPGIVNANQPVGVLQRWRFPGDLSSTARVTTRPGQSDSYFKGTSDGGYTDASFIRLSNLSLSYSLPASFIERIGIQGCSIFFHTNNLFVITKYKGIDPETQKFGQLPPFKTIVAGLSLNF